MSTSPFIIFIGFSIIKGINIRIKLKIDRIKNDLFLKFHPPQKFNCINFY
jgi:hypothetical protein